MTDQPTDPSRPEDEPTAPIAPLAPPSPPPVVRAPAPAWVPPAAPPVPPAGGWVPPGGTQPYPVATVLPARSRTGRVSGWIWPVVAVLALVLGVVGGVGGAVVLRAVDSDGTVAGGLGGVDTVSLPPLDPDNASIASVAQELLPSTVQIVAEFGGQAGGATGSGFVLDQQGHIITNNHVVADAADSQGAIEVVDSDGNRYDATVVGRSPVYDLAVLSVDGAESLRPAALGASANLRIGDGVVAIGSPLGLTSTVTAGIVSALHRPVSTGDTAEESSYIDAVQTDAAINPGNSGGPLVNLLGQVVGVNSAIATTGGGLTGSESGNIGVGFAIPVEQVRVTADQILRTGEARYPVIGAKVLTGNETTDGAEIDEVNPGTPAEDAGLQQGDVVTEVEGQRVTDGIALIVAIRTHQPGETIEFVVERGGDEQTVDITLGSEVG